MKEKIKWALNNIYKNKYIENKKTFEDKKTGTEGYVGKVGDVFVAEFSGTDFDSKADRKTIFYFPKKSIPYNNSKSKIRIHSGFSNAYQSVREFIHQRLKDSGLKKVFLAGHSLGGAMATLCAVDIQYNFPGLEIDVVTTGSPRVGNPAFAKSFNKRVPNSIRIVNKKDVVTKLPPFIFFFKHIKDKFKIGKCAWWKLFSVKNHSKALYFKEMEKL